MNAACNTTMSTQVWWLDRTRYQPSRRNSSAPLACQLRDPEPRRASALTEIQFSAIAISQFVSTRRTAIHGSRNLSTPSSSTGTNQNTVLSVKTPNVNTPRICRRSDRIQVPYLLKPSAAF